MHLPSLPHPPNPQPPEGGRWGQVFAVISSVSLAVVTGKMLLDMVRGHKAARHEPRGKAEDLGPLVRREVERALAEHDAHRGRGG
jgi:hypothetical protein